MERSAKRTRSLLIGVFAALSAYYRIHDGGNGNLEKYRNQLMPRVVVAEELTKLEQSMGTHFPARQLGSTPLRVAYVIDRGKDVAYVDDEIMGKLGVSASAFESIAIGNLRKLYHPDILKGALDGHVEILAEDSSPEWLLLIPESLGPRDTVGAVLDDGILNLMPAPEGGDWSVYSARVAAVTPGRRSFPLLLRLTRGSVETLVLPPPTPAPLPTLRAIAPSLDIDTEQSQLSNESEDNEPARVDPQPTVAVVVTDTDPQRPLDWRPGSFSRQGRQNAPSNAASTDRTNSETRSTTLRLSAKPVVHGGLGDRQEVEIAVQNTGERNAESVGVSIDIPGAGRIRASGPHVIRRSGIETFRAEFSNKIHISLPEDLKVHLECSICPSVTMSSAGEKSAR